MNWSPMQPVTEFAPSADPTVPGVLLDAENIVPTDRGWRSAYSLASTGMASLTATCVGAELGTKKDGTQILFAGCGSEIFTHSGATWATVTAAATTYNADEDQRWRWAMMGDYVLAANVSDSIQVSNAGATFTTIDTAPKAALIESVYGFIMAANTIDGTYGTQPDRWWCSALFDHTSWTPSVTTQATSGRLVDTPGPITGLRRLGPSVVAYKRNSMYLGQYVEPPTVWQWQLISSNIGCPSHEAVVNIGRAHLFCALDNFYSYDGAQILPIGESVRRWFFDTKLYSTYATRIQAVHDKSRALVYWFYPEAGGTATLTKAVVYNYRVGRWGVGTYAVQAGVEYVAAGITYDLLGTYYSTYDAGIDRTYDSPLWIPDTTAPAVFTTGGVIATLDGAGSTSSITTGLVGDDQAYTLLRRLRVRWLDDPTSATLSLYGIKELGGVSCLCGTAVQTQNKFDILRSSRWHQAKIDMTGSHEFTAVAVDLEPQGMW